MLGTIISGAFGLVSEGVKGFFGVKQRQADLFDHGIQAFSDANNSAASREQAIATVLSSEMSSGYWLAAVWRPLIMVVIAGLVTAYFFGYTTPNLLMPMPENSLIGELFEILKIGIMGYMPLRSIEKIATQVNLGRIINKILDKKAG
jgi:hypothetical protein